MLYSNEGRTSGKFKDLAEAGRLDIVVHALIHAFFLSNAMRSNVHFHAVLHGPPDPPKHIEFISNLQTPYSKKDVGTLLQIALWKYKPEKKVQALPGVWVEKKDFRSVVSELERKGHSIYLLDPKGKSIDCVEMAPNPVFVLGDHLGIPKWERKWIVKRCAATISLGKLPYFTSQCIAVLNFWLDKNDKEFGIWLTQQ